MCANTTVKHAKYLIVGNSTAAIAAVEGIRKVDRTSEIVLVAKEPYHTYSRPLISYLLAGTIDDERVLYRPRNFYESNGVRAELGIEVVRVDAHSRTVETFDGRRIGFEKLLIATGGRPFVPRMDGLPAKGVFTFTSWDDAKALDAHIRSGARRAVVVGGGLIGIKAAEALRARGLEVLIVELGRRLLPLAFDETASALAAEAASRAGVELLTNTTVERVRSEGGTVAGVRLTTGREIACDTLVFAIGVVPETSHVQGSGLAVAKGIVIDDRCSTNVEGIFAAGDVSEGLDTAAGNTRPIPIFPNAYRQGWTAGINMAGGEARTGPLFAMNSVEVFGIPTVSAGLATAEGEGFDVLNKLDRVSGTYRRVVLRDGRLVGMLCVGAIDRAGIFTGLIRSGVNVEDIRDSFLSDGFGILTLPIGYKKHLIKGEVIET